VQAQCNLSQQPAVCFEQTETPLLLQSTADQARPLRLHQ
jgi:hypothetical protein